jgi:hypothetical protein
MKLFDGRLLPLSRLDQAQRAIDVARPLEGPVLAPLARLATVLTRAEARRLLIEAELDADAVLA